MLFSQFFRDGQFFEDTELSLIKIIKNGFQ